MKKIPIVLVAVASLGGAILSRTNAGPSQPTEPEVGPIGLHLDDDLETPDFNLTVVGWASAGEDDWLFLEDGGWIGKTYRINLTNFSAFTVSCPHGE